LSTTSAIRVVEAVWRRPGRTSHENDLSSIDTFGSPESATRSLTLSPVTPCALVVNVPPCHGSEIWCSVRPSICSGRMRCVTFARASMIPRSVSMHIQPPSSMPRSAASSGSSSANISGCSSASHGRFRLIGPAVWCSVSRNVEATIG